MYLKWFGIVLPLRLVMFNNGIPSRSRPFTFSAPTASGDAR
jgi:hypothetical protein